MRALSSLAGDDLRWNDHSLSEDEASVLDLFADFFARESPVETVAAAEPFGFDRGLWERLAAVGAVTMGVPEASGGGGAGLVEMTLAAEEHGRRLAPVPLAETAVAARLLARHEAGLPVLARVVEAAGLVTIGLCPTGEGNPQLVSGAPYAEAVVLLDGARLVVVTPPGSLPPLPNLGRLPIATVDASSGSSTVLAVGDEARASFGRARREWQLLTSGALIGMADQCLSVAVDHARQRTQFGVPIGTFQAVSHPLADLSVAVQAGRRLTRKAAWCADHEARWWWATAAFIHAASTSVRAAQVAAHTLGGVGVTESVIVHYLRRAKAWALLGGDPEDELLTLAGELFDDVEGRG